MPQGATPAQHAVAPAAGTPRDAHLPDLADDADVVFAINVATAQLVAASPAARQALGLTTAQPMPVALDSAMPALRRLKSLAADPSAADVLETLDFWSLSGGIVSRNWHLAPAGDGAAPSVMLVRSALDFAADLDADDRRDAIAYAPFDAYDDIGPDPTLAPRDDAETLKEIARQIRDGRLSARVSKFESAVDDDPADVATGIDVSAAVEPEPPAEAIAEASAATPADEPPAPPPTMTALTPLPPRAAASALTPEDLARLAHELKTPLTAIAAAAEIMRDERLGDMGNDRYLDYARDIHESAAHALAVITRLLARGDASDAERDRIEIIDLNDLVERTVATLQPLAAERRVTLAVDADDGHPVVTASPTALRQILLNLLSNALKFTPPRGDVRAVTGYLPDGGVFLAVRDTGDGIDEATVRHALDEADAEMAQRAGGGYGIGLPLVCRLVADIGAGIQFDSEPGRGTVVLISFGGRRGYRN